MEIQPASLHQRVPLIFGSSKNEVERISATTATTPAQPSRPSTTRCSTSGPCSGPGNWRRTGVGQASIVVDHRLVRRGHILGDQDLPAHLPARGRSTGDRGRATRSTGYDREQDQGRMAAAEEGTTSSFLAEVSCSRSWETLFREYGEHGRGKVRKYLHDPQEAEPYGQQPGVPARPGRTSTLTATCSLRGLHRAAVTGKAETASTRTCWSGLSRSSPGSRSISCTGTRQPAATPSEEVVDTVLRRMPDYATTPAVLPHARELPAGADRGHVQPVHRP